VGDSGMFSRRGVEPPLVGGPQTLGRRPSCAWISRALQEVSQDDIEKWRCVEVWRCFDG
jgi:hypothetical protein